MKRRAGRQKHLFFSFTKKNPGLPVLAALFAVLCLPSCKDAESSVAVLWTDRPDFAFYAGYFNASQDRYKVEVLQRAFPPAARYGESSGKIPDIAVAGYLRGALVREYLVPLEPHLETEGGFTEAFYPSLLSAGNFDGKQYLLPVSFNTALIAFDSANENLLSGPLTVGLDEMTQLGLSFNRTSGGRFSRIGFSPSWDGGFLFTAASMLGADFEEARPLSWNGEALGLAMDRMREWDTAANGETGNIADFTFRFFTVPPAAMLLSGRILFAYMDSSSFFTLNTAQRESLDFRWLAGNERIPLTEDTAYLGLTKAGRAPKAAWAFVRWFFDSETQLEMLEKSRQFRQMETSFGIAGGFSSLRPVTQQFFPRFYPALMGRIPPEDFLVPQGPLPGDWPAMKEQAVLPYLKDRAMPQPEAGSTGASLEARLAEWVRLNRL